MQLKQMSKDQRGKVYALAVCFLALGVMTTILGNPIFHYVIYLFITSMYMMDQLFEDK